MIEVTCIRKNRDKNNRVCSYVLADLNNNTKTVSSDELKQAIRSGNIYITNLKLTSDNRLIDCKNKNMHKVITLYHGSIYSTLKSEFGKGEDKHDYGRGLYLTPDIELAKEWSVCTGNNIGFVYKIHVDIHNLNILDFDKLSELNWIAELMSHRDAWDSARYRKLAPLFIQKYKVNTEKYDIIRGWRADSSYFSIAKEFVRDNLDISILNKALRIGNQGIQYCLKTQRAFSNIVSCDLECTVRSQEYLVKYNIRDSNAREQLKKLINSSENTLEHVFSDL